jgi:hypothetical protein
MSVSSYLYRRFTAEIEAVADAWYETPVMAAPWTPTRAVDSKHSTSPWWASSQTGDLKAVLKPGPHAGHDEIAERHGDLHELFENTVRTYIDTVPVAAIEKIAGDFAYNLKLPVPPVCLYQNDNAQTPAARAACLSLVCFQPSPKSTIDLIKEMDDDQLAHFLHCESAISVFKGWLHNGDPRMQNTVIDEEDKSPAYVDFSASTLYRWKNKQEYRKPIVTQADYIIRPDTLQTLEAIQSMPQAILRGTVERIPSFFMNDEKKEAIINGLEYRQKNLENLVMKKNIARTFNSAEEGVKYLREKVLIAKRLRREHNLD